MTKDETTSFRLPVDLLAALREHAAQSGESLSDTMRRAALELLGTCPTCGQRPRLIGPPLDEDGHHPEGDYDLWHMAVYIPAVPRGSDEAVAGLLASNGIETYRMWPVENVPQMKAAMDELEASLKAEDGTDGR